MRMTPGLLWNAGAAGAELRAARLRLGWTLRTAERVSGVQNAHISQIETGKIAQPGFAVLARLATAYGIPLSRMTDGRCPACGQDLPS